MSPDALEEVLVGAPPEKRSEPAFLRMLAAELKRFDDGRAHLFEWQADHADEPSYTELPQTLKHRNRVWEAWFGGEQTGVTWEWGYPVSFRAWVDHSFEYERRYPWTSVVRELILDGPPYIFEDAAAAVLSGEYPSLRALTVRHSSIDAELARAMTSRAWYGRLSSLVLARTELSHSAMESVLRALPPSLERLRIHTVWPDPPSGAVSSLQETFARSIPTARMEELGLGPGAFDTPSWALLCERPWKRLRRLDLAGLTLEEAAIAPFVSSTMSEHLVDLDLRDTRFGRRILEDLLSAGRLAEGATVVLNRAEIDDGAVAHMQRTSSVELVFS